MARYEKRGQYRTGRYYDYYTEGNAVRRAYYETTPVRREDTTPDTHVQPKRQAQPKERTAINYGYIIAMALAAAIIVFMSITVLELKTQSDANLDTINSLQKQITGLAADNAVKELDIYSSIDYQELYNRAIAMGMGNITSDQIITYDREVLEYVKQYGDIPEK